MPVGAHVVGTGPDRSRLAAPCRTTWTFDVELLARMARGHDARGHGAMEEAVYELPLVRWRDVAGSKLRTRDALRAVAEVGVVYRTYRLPRTGRPG